MEGDFYPDMITGSAIPMDEKVVQKFKDKFVEVQNILDQNRLLLNEINQNHESKAPENLSKNLRLIKELNKNIRRVVELCAEISSSFVRFREASSEGQSAKTLSSEKMGGQKRIQTG